MSARHSIVLDYRTGPGGTRVTARCECGWDSPEVADPMTAAAHGMRHEGTAHKLASLMAERFPAMA